MSDQTITPREAARSAAVAPIQGLGDVTEYAWHRRMGADAASDLWAARAWDTLTALDDAVEHGDMGAVVAARNDLESWLTGTVASGPDPDGYEIEMAHEDDHVRTELRRYPDCLVMVRMRRAVPGGWYVRDSVTLPTTGTGS